MVNAGNAAATSAGRVTAASIAEGRTIAQTLVPALTNGINRTRTLEEAQNALGQDATRQVGQMLAAMRTRRETAGNSIRDVLTNARVSNDPVIPRTVQADRPTITTASSALTISPAGTANLGQLASAAVGARLAIERQTEAVNASRGAFAQLTQVAESTARTYRQPTAAPAAPASTRAPSAAAATLTAAPQASPNAMREVAQAMSATATQATRVATTVTEANRAIAATPRTTVLATSAAPATRAPLVAQPIVSAATGQRVPTATGSQTAQLAVDAGRAQTTVERLTAAARAQRSALAELAPAAAAAAGSYRQIAATPIRMDAPQGISATAAALANVAAQAQNARRSIADLSRASIPAPAQQPVMSQIVARQAPASTSVSEVIANAPNPSGMSAFAAATAHGTTATNAFTAAEGRAAEAGLRLAEANARNEAAQARLAVATARAAAAQTAFDNASRSSSSSTEAIAAAQTRMQSAQAAVSTASAAAARSQRSAADAADRHRTALNSLGRQSTLTAHQQQQLSFQLNDFFVQVASGQSPLTAFIQQGSQLSGTFGGAGGAFRAVLSAITPARVAIGGAATAVGALAMAYYEGSRQSKGFADAVVLTGNYAGQTEGKINSLTREIASHGQVTASAAREAAQAALGSGQIGPQVFAQATEAIALYAQATDRAADEVIKDFANMARSPSKWAEEHNRTLNFITAKQIDLAEDFEKAGDAAKAQGVVITALIDRLHQLDPNLGTIERTLRSAKSAWSNFWDAAYDIGRTETIESKIANLDAKIRESRNRSNPFAPAPQSRTAQLAGNDTHSLEYQLQDALAGQAVTEANAFNKAADAEAQQAGITAKSVIDGYLRRGKAASLYKEKLDELNRSFKDRAAAGTPVSASDQKTAFAELKKEFTPPKNSEAAQVLRAQLQNDLKGIQDVFEKERDTYQFQNAFVETAYRNGTISLSTLMDQRREVIENVANAQITELDKESARLQEHLKQTKDPSERVQTQTRITEIGVKREEVETKKSRDIVLLNEERTASFKALSEQVANYRANLLQMEGDEAGAATVRSQLAIESAKVLAAQSAKLPAGQITDEEISQLTRRTEILNQFNEVQRQTSLLTSNSARAEEAYLDAAEQSGKSLTETEQGLYQLRSQELGQLGALAAKAKELAEASQNPALKAFAADLALSYAKAAKAIDPALQRLRDANRELAAGLAQTVSNAPNAFVEYYSQRRSESERDIKSQKDEYSRRIDQLRGYLAEEKDVRNKASLQKRINQLQGESDGLKVESKGKTALNAFSKTVLEPAAQQVSASISKVLIQDPLQAYFKDKLTKLTEGDGALAGVFKDALGIKADPKQAALLQQTAAIEASISAVDAFRVAAENAANALNKPLLGAPSKSAGEVSGERASLDGLASSYDPTQPPPVDAELAGVQGDATKSLSLFSTQATTTASDVLKMANAAHLGGDAMVRLPGIVGLFQSAVMAMQTSSATSGSGGGLFGAIASLFGGGGEAGAYEAAVAATGIFHSGGIVGQPPATRNVSMSMFAGAPRYHTGGIVGKAADKAGEKLKHNEVPAILMGGPKGRREEVLHAADPRHRDNLGMSIVARILAESKAEKSPFSKAAKTVETRSTVSTLLQSIAGSKVEGESSANLLGGLLDRLGVKDESESAVASAVKVRGARELGGPVSAGGMYRVNEKGRDQPELLEVAGKQYLMMGSQGGTVEPKGGGADRRTQPTIVNVNVTPPAGASRASAAQWGADAGRHIQRSLSRNG
jgi:phage-related minor tail protein